ncbi:hypothetical protein [Methanobrevibacter sp.]|uniref:hypothetical protein n=1 Tax=Methanobrevibacter sp. TaxID=66852 RepID=UPI00388E5282
MALTEQIKRSWWVILSFIMMLNGFGFVYIGLKHYNKNWVLEGITYEIPWFFYFIFFARYGYPNAPVSAILTISFLLLLVSIVRSIWVAIKLGDVYDNNEKYTIQQTALNSHKEVQNNSNDSPAWACCLCIFGLIALYALVSLF